MATTQPGSGPNLIRDAHTHPIALTAAYAAYVAGIAAVITNTANKRAEEDRNRRRATDYARGILGGHGER